MGNQVKCCSVECGVEDGGVVRDEPGRWVGRGCSCGPQGPKRVWLLFQTTGKPLKVLKSQTNDLKLVLASVWRGDTGRGRAGAEVGKGAAQCSGRAVGVERRGRDWLEVGGHGSREC